MLVISFFKKTTIESFADVLVYDTLHVNYIKN